MQRLNVASKTRYPEIFSETYWGAFDVEENPAITDAIIENRNKFIERYRLIECDGFSKDSFESLIHTHHFRDGYTYWDHIECYTQGPGVDDGVVVVNSPYGKVQQVHEHMTSVDFDLVATIYSEKARSFVKVFKRRDDFWKFAKDYHRTFCTECGFAHCSALVSFLTSEQEKAMLEQEDASTY